MKITRSAERDKKPAFSLTTFLFGFGIWAAIVGGILLRKTGNVQQLAEHISPDNIWLGLIGIYVFLFFSPVFAIFFLWTDRIDSKWGRFGAQLLVCLLLAIAFCLVLAFLTL